MFIIGIVIFLIGSALSGLSQNMEQLILFRGIQGIGAGALFPIALAIIGDMFSPAERGKYQGLFGAVFGVAFVAGPLIGGWLTENVSWHWIFYVNIPIGIVALYFISRLLPTVKNAGRDRNFDILGGVIFTIATAVLLIGLTNKGLTTRPPSLYEWTDWQVGGLILVGLVGYLAFIWAETRAKEPIVPLDLFRNRTYASSMLVDVLRGLRLLRGDHLPAALVPDRPGASARRTPAGAPAARRRPDRQLDRVGPVRGPDRPLQVAARRRDLADGGRDALMTQLTADTPVPIVWLWMFITGLGVGPTLRGVHARRPERRAVQHARRRDVEPDVLPPDRRLGRPGHRRNGLRHGVRRSSCAVR